MNRQYRNEDNAERNSDLQNELHSANVSAFQSPCAQPNCIDNSKAEEQTFHKSLTRQKSIFTEIELKRAPSLFEKDNKEIQDEIDQKMVNHNILDTPKHSKIPKKEGNPVGQTDNKTLNTTFSLNSNNINNGSSNSRQKSNSILNARRSLFLIFEDPMSSVSGRIVHWTIQFFIILSVALIISDSVYLDDTITNSYSDFSNDLETVVFVVFLLEFIARLAVCTSFGETFLAFIVKPLNVIDILSLLPFLFDIVSQSLTSTNSSRVGLLRVIRIIRLIRIIRIFKLSRYMKGLNTLQKSLAVSKNYFPFICTALLVFNIFSATIIYYFEINGTFTEEYFLNLKILQSTRIQSIPQSMWFVLETMTTLGYGDKLPLTIQSKLLSGMIALLSQSFVIGLPIAIVGFDFANVYKEQKEKVKFDRYKTLGMEGNKDDNYKTKELHFMQERLRKISKTNKRIRELSSCSSKMCFLITKDLVNLFFQVVMGEQREIEKQTEGLNIQDQQKLTHLRKILGTKYKIKMEDIFKNPNSLKSNSRDGSSQNQELLNVLSNLLPDDGINQQKKADSSSRGFQFLRQNLKNLKILLEQNNQMQDNQEVIMIDDDEDYENSSSNVDQMQRNVEDNKNNDECADAVVVPAHSSSFSNVKDSRNEKNLIPSKNNKNLVHKVQLDTSSKQNGDSFKQNISPGRNLRGVIKNARDLVKQAPSLGDQNQQMQNLHKQVDLLSEMLEDLDETIIDSQEIDEDYQDPSKKNNNLAQNPRFEEGSIFKIDRLEKIKEDQLKDTHLNFSSVSELNKEFNPNPKANKEIKEVETIAGNLQNLDIKYNIFDSHDYAKANRSNLLSTNPQFPSLTTHEAWNFQEEKKDDALLIVGQLNLLTQKQRSLADNKQTEDEQDQLSLQENKIGGGCIESVIPVDKRVVKKNESIGFHQQIKNQIEERSDEEEVNSPKKQETNIEVIQQIFQAQYCYSPTNKQFSGLKSKQNLDTADKSVQTDNLIAESSQDTVSFQ